MAGADTVDQLKPEGLVGEALLACSRLGSRRDEGDRTMTLAAGA
jgi:hypothetical protein